jgi:hypothetical protein
MISLSHWGEFDMPWHVLSSWLTTAKATGQWQPPKDLAGLPTKAHYEAVLQKLNFGRELT